MRKIKLYGRRGKDCFSLVDDEDFERVNKYKWFISKSGYIRRNITVNRKASGQYIHRFIMIPPVGKHIDHINHDRLDNRKDNLRLVTNAQNSKNRKISGRNTSGYKGVYYHNRPLRKRWHAQIYADGKNMFLGYFVTKEEAAFAYNEAAIKYHGEFSNLNRLS